MEHKPRLEGIDQAVLAGTALIAVITVNLENNVWDPFTTVVGIVMLLIMTAFYRSAPSPDRRALHLRTVAVSAVAALCICLAAGWPIQHLDIHYWKLNTFWLECGQKTFVQKYMSENGECVTDQTTNYLLPPLWLILTLTLYAVRMLTRRSRGPQAPLSPGNTATPRIPEHRHANLAETPHPKTDRRPGGSPSQQHATPTTQTERSGPESE